MTCITAPVIYFVLDSDVALARFFDEHEKAMAIERLRAHQTGTGSNEFKWRQAYEILYEPMIIRCPWRMSPMARMRGVCLVRMVRRPSMPVSYIADAEFSSS